MQFLKKKLKTYWEKRFAMGTEDIPEVAKEYGVTQGQVLSYLEEEAEAGRLTRIDLGDRIVWLDRRKPWKRSKRQ